MTGKPIQKPDYVEVDINDPVQMSKINQQMEQRKSRKNFSPKRLNQA